jgi:hypothetical protein
VGRRGKGKIVDLLAETLGRRVPLPVLPRSTSLSTGTGPPTRIRLSFLRRYAKFADLAAPDGELYAS